MLSGLSHTRVPRSIPRSLAISTCHQLGPRRRARLRAVEVGTTLSIALDKGDGDGGGGDSAGTATGFLPSCGGLAHHGRHTRRGLTRKISTSVDNNIRKTCQACGGSKMAAVARHGARRGPAPAAGAENSQSPWAMIAVGSTARRPICSGLTPDDAAGGTHDGRGLAPRGELVPRSVEHNLYAEAYSFARFFFSEACSLAYFAPCRVSDALERTLGKEMRGNRCEPIHRLSSRRISLSHSVNRPTFESRQLQDFPRS